MYTSISQHTEMVLIRTVSLESSFGNHLPLILSFLWIYNSDQELVKSSLEQGRASGDAKESPRILTFENIHTECQMPSYSTLANRLPIF